MTSSFVHWTLQQRDVFVAVRNCNCNSSRKCARHINLSHTHTHTGGAGAVGKEAFFYAYIITAAAARDEERALFTVWPGRAVSTPAHRRERCAILAPNFFCSHSLSLPFFLFPFFFKYRILRNSRPDTIYINWQQQQREEKAWNILSLCRTGGTAPIWMTSALFFLRVSSGLVDRSIIPLFQIFPCPRLR